MNVVLVVIADKGIVQMGTITGLDRSQMTPSFGLVQSIHKGQVSVAACAIRSVQKSPTSAFTQHKNIFIAGMSVANHFKLLGNVCAEVVGLLAVGQFHDAEIGCEIAILFLRLQKRFDILLDLLDNFKRIIRT